MTKPALFVDLELDDALLKSEVMEKLLLIDATASWCGPCQIMDRTTWVDPAVVAALRDRVLAIQIDVDERAEVAERLRIKAMPTVVAFRMGREVDRVTGLQKPGELVAWVEALEAGRTSLDASRGAVAEQPEDMQLRMLHAQKLVDLGRLDEATKEYVWLWEHMLEHEPNMQGVRLSLLVGDMKSLAQDHPAAREAFARVRDAMRPSGDPRPDPERLGDWFALNGVLDEHAESVWWFDAHGARLDVDERLAKVLENTLVPLFAEARRWGDAGALYRDPLASLEQAAAVRQHMLARLPAKNAPREMAEQVHMIADMAFRETTSSLVQALRAAKRHDDVLAVSAAAMRHDPSPEMSAVLSEA